MHIWNSATIRAPLRCRKLFRNVIKLNAWNKSPEGGGRGAGGLSREARGGDYNSTTSTLGFIHNFLQVYLLRYLLHIYVFAIVVLHRVSHNNAIRRCDKSNNTKIRKEVFSFKWKVKIRHLKMCLNYILIFS